MFWNFGHWFAKIWEQLSEILAELKCIHRDVIKILRLIALKEIDFVQVGGGMNFSIVRGAVGTFTAVLNPASGGQAAGTVPKWAADDTTIVLAPSADGLSCDVTAPTGGTVTTFNLTLTATSSDSAVGDVSASHGISVTEPPPPPLQSIDFVQSAG